MKGLAFRSGSSASAGRLAGVMTSTTPGWALAASTLRERDAAASDAADRDDGVEHPRRMIVGGISGGAGDFQDAVAAGQRLADVRAVANMRRRFGVSAMSGMERQLRERRQRGTPAAPAGAPACRRPRASERPHHDTPGEFDLEGVVAGRFCAGERRLGGAVENRGSGARASQNLLRLRGPATASAPRRRAPAAPPRSLRRRRANAAAADTTANAYDVRSRTFR